ncbi:DUF3343 domain-containing protein [Clostridium cylindrosporum]|uniref:Putative Se/S carrier protein-like domain-containing protein n=1 Tax=Clostridium cylindrosporum DSM 605 TaxID=1121307 RepID=A0A0J8D6R6_CLOCY|nr:DUF3343 domain-containing protein [Clostridium cylindrosporum]KMT21775.1 hypothetical protein CLCY_3c00420 [Clostridium cylindrosporum DSM 605]
MDKYIVITFESVNFAMQTESVLKGKELAHQIIPTPREITLSCGLSVKTAYENIDIIKELIEDKSIRTKKMYVFEGLGSNKTFKEM